MRESESIIEELESDILDIYTLDLLAELKKNIVSRDEEVKKLMEALGKIAKDRGLLTDDDAVNFKDIAEEVLRELKEIKL